MIVRAALLAASAVIALSGALAQADPPARWTPQGIGGGGAMYSPTIHPANGAEMYVSCDMTPTFHSGDGGKSWQTLDFRQVTGGHACAVQCTKDPNIRWTLDYNAGGGGDNVRPKRSADGGRTWNYLRPAWPDARRAYALCADYQNPDRALIAADYRELWVTLDGGRTFEKRLDAADRNAGMHLAGAFFDGDTIYAGIVDGLYVSKDGGRSFAKDPAQGIPPGNGIVSFAGGKSGGKVRLFAVTLKNVYAGITGGDHNGYSGIYTLEVGRTEWTRCVNGLAPTAHPFFVKMAMNDADTAYVAGGSQQGAPTVFKTSDGGAAWTDVFQTAGNRNIVCGYAGDGGDFRWSWPEYALGFDVSLLDKNRLLMTDLGMAHASDDGGRTWRAVYTGFTTARAPGPIPKGAAYACNGLEVTSIWDVLWADTQNVIVSATDIKGYRSSDGGKTWSFNYTGHDLNTMYRAVRHPATGALYAATSSVHDLYMSTYLQDARIDKGRGFVLVSRDNGANWKPLGNIAKPVIWVALDPRAPNRLYASVVHSAEGGIYVTDDLDKPQVVWRRLSAPPRTEGHPYNIHVLSDGAVVCTFSGRRVPAAANARQLQFTLSAGVFLSADGGQTWEDRSDPRMRLWTKDVVIDPSDKAQNTWYAGVFHAWGPGGGNGKCGLYRTRDRGRTWALIADSAIAPSRVLNVESCAFNPANPDELYFTTEYDGLFHTSNASAEKPAFQPVASFPFRQPVRIFFNPNRKTEMWVTTFGNGMWVGEVGK